MDRNLLRLMVYEVQYQTPSSPSRAEFDDYAVADDFVRDHGGSIWRVTREPIRSTQMPVGDLPGWKQVLTEDFTRPVPLGGFTANQQGVLTTSGAAGYQAYGPGRSGGNEMRVYPDGWDTTHKTAFYAPSKTLSVRNDVPGTNGCLDVFHRSGTPLGGSTAKALGAAVWFPLAAYNGAYRIGPYVRAEFRLRTTDWNVSNPSYYHAVPLFIGSPWPNNGEFDWPEQDAAQNSPVAGWHHRASTNKSDQDRINGPAGFVMGDWHRYAVEWTPTSVKYFCDDILCFTSTTQLPVNPMAFVLQFEATNVAPAATTEGHVQVDWLTLYSFAP